MSEKGEKKTEEDKRHWLKVGVELEGGWDDPLQDIARKCVGAEIRHDGSVDVPQALIAGEVTTRPHETSDGLLADIAKMYPVHVNESCGFHIHVSFKPLDMSCLATREFNTYFLDRWERWGAATLTGTKNGPILDYFYRRLHGKPTGPRRQAYCKPDFNAEAQLKKKDNALRYTALNFGAYHKYMTLECRVLPMFPDPSHAALAVKELLAMYEDYLTRVGFPKIEMERKVVLDLGPGGVGVQETYDMTCADRTPLSHDFGYEHEAVVTGPDVFYAFEGSPGASAYMHPFRESVDDEAAL